jgi:DNA-directed RNA polymerase specialized sigma24 family protein
MTEPVSAALMNEQDLQISRVMAEEGARLRNFIRKRVPNESDVEELFQEIFFELVQASPSTTSLAGCSA